MKSLDPSNVNVKSDNESIVSAAFNIDFSMPVLQQPSSFPTPNSRGVKSTATHKPTKRGQAKSTTQQRCRKMPAVDIEAETLSTTESNPESQASHENHSGTDRRSSTVSDRSQQRSTTPSRDSETPVTPEESPPSILKKRTASFAELEDKEGSSAASSPIHTRTDSADHATHVCICQRDPKIPRPRNAFILYRQHHQAAIVAQHPRLANPEISKIIGEQWQKQSLEVKAKWKGLAEEEKLRHQQQYPDYRYQPKRAGRRGSVLETPISATSEKERCPKCAGRHIINLASPAPNTGGFPRTPGFNTIAPVARALPTLSNMSIQSPALRRNVGPFPMTEMPPPPPGFYNITTDDRDNLGSMSPEFKRRRHNTAEYPQTLVRTMPPRHPNAGGAAAPGTPFPFANGSPHPYPSASANAHRESLPGLRGMVSPAGPMAPPPPRAPRMGYQQHRATNGNPAHDRSLTLPPLQTNATVRPGPTTATPGLGPRTAEEHIMSMPFRYKIKTLGQIAPPFPVNATNPRGPVIAIEGDNAEAVAKLAEWLQNEFNKDSDLDAQLVPGPDVSVKPSARKPMIEYHNLVSEWLAKSDEIISAITKAPTSSPVDSHMAGTSPRKFSIREPIDENYDNESTPSADGKDQNGSRRSSSSNAEEAGDRGSAKPSKRTSNPSGRPVVIIPNFSVHASNVFACRIPIAAHDAYAPRDHWQWTATQWRGVVGPDLTIFLRDEPAHGSGNESAGGAGKPSVEMGEEGNLAVVKRSLASGGDVEAPVLRRLGFEVSEWVRAFDVHASSAV